MLLPNSTALMQKLSTFKKTCRLLAVAAALHLAAAAANAQTVQHQLDRSHSTVHFEINGNLLSLSGSFNSYSGSIAFDGPSPVPKSVRMKVDLSDVTIGQTKSLGSLNAFSPEAVFRAMPNPIVNFESSKITRVAQNKYRIDGTLTRGKKQWDAHVQASVNRASQNRSEVFVNLSGALMQFARELPIFALNGANDEGQLNAHLIFIGRAPAAAPANAH